MKRVGLVAFATAWMALASLPGDAAAFAGDPDASANRVEARVWLDRGVEAVLQSGDQVRVYYRVNADAHVALFHMDTNGFIRLLAPGGPGETTRVRGDRDYRLLFPEANFWTVEDPPGIGYFFLLASPEEFDFRGLGYSPLRGGWDLTPVGSRVYGDPHQAMDRFVATLLPNWDRGEFALDFAAYNVGQAYSFPRFLCYDCHGYEPFRNWNPYHSTCLNFRVVIYNDPYFYPATRYQANRVVFSRPETLGRAQYAFQERSSGEPGTPVIQARPSAERAGATSASTSERIWLQDEDEIRSFMEAWRGGEAIDPAAAPSGPTRDAVSPPWPGGARTPGMALPGDRILPDRRTGTAAPPAAPPVRVPEARPAPSRAVPERRHILQRRPEPPPVPRPGGG